MDREKFNQLLTQSAQSPIEFWHFLNFLIAHKSKYKNIIEIGIYYGGTTNVFKELLEENSILLGIDNNELKMMDFAQKRFKDYERAFIFLKKNQYVGHENNCIIAKMLEEANQKVVYKKLNKNKTRKEFIKHGKSLLDFFKDTKGDHSNTIFFEEYSSCFNLYSSFNS